MDLEYYNSYFEVSLTTIKENVEKVRKYIGEGHEIMPVIKGNCYGSGTVEVAKLVANECGVGIIGCGQVAEAVEIREAGIGCDILVLSSPVQHALKYAVQYDLMVPVFEEMSAKTLSDEAKKLGKTAHVHIKIETGMNRIGVKPGEPLSKLVDYIKSLGNVEIAGIFTHYATSDVIGNDLSIHQLEIFNTAVKQLGGMGITPKYIHSCNSNAIVWLKDGYGTHVRTGSMYLGYSIIDDENNKVGVKESASWRAFIVNVHDVYPGEQVGYSGAYVPKVKTKVATISIGYADGLFRPLAQTGGPVLVNGKRAKYLGLCMDQTFIDVTGVDCKIGDEVTLVGYDKLTGELLSAYELQNYVDQTYVYQFCSIGPRVKRVYTR